MNVYAEAGGGHFRAEVLRFRGLEQDGESRLVAAGGDASRLLGDAGQHLRVVVPFRVRVVVERAAVAFRRVDRLEKPVTPLQRALPRAPLDKFATLRRQLFQQVVHVLVVQVHELKRRDLNALSYFDAILINLHRSALDIPCRFHSSIP